MTIASWIQPISFSLWSCSAVMRARTAGGRSWLASSAAVKRMSVATRLRSHRMQHSPCGHAFRLSFRQPQAARRAAGIVVGAERAVAQPPLEALARKAAGEQDVPAAARQHRRHRALLAVAAPGPVLRVRIRQEDVID